jgi:hypothetical protein
VAWDTTELLASVRQRAMLPTATGDGTADADILRFATEEIRTRLAPYLLQAREEFLVSSSSAALVSGKAAYRINGRALGSKLNRIALIDSSGLERALTLIKPSDRRLYPQTGVPVAYSVEAASVVLTPTPDSSSTSFTLKQWFYMRQSDLVTVAAAGVIEVIDGNQVTLSTADVPAASMSTRYDLIRATPGFEPLALDLLPTGLPFANTFEFASLPADLEVGDYLCIAGQSPVPYLPADLHPVLYQRVAVKMLESLGDSEGLANAKRELDEMERMALALITPRVDAQPHVFVDNSLLSALE